MNRAEASVGEDLSGDIPAKTQSSSPARPRERIDYLEYFRAIAIVLIVTGHAFDLAWTRASSEHSLDSIPLLGFVSALVNGGTIYFVFISGFLYRHVFYERVGYGEFMRKKALHVGLPYLLLGSSLAILQMLISGFHVTIMKHGLYLGENPFVDLLVQLATGAMMTGYWYIPFIFVIFLASPLFDRFAGLGPARQVAILVLALVVALWVHRPFENLNPVHSAAYFLVAYLFGIVMCQHRHRIMPVLRSWPAIVLSLAGLLSVAAFQDLIVQQINILERAPGDGLLPLQFDWMIVQKFFGILAITGLAMRIGGGLSRPLGFLAANSFGIYFVHGIVLAAMSHAPHWLSPHVGASIIDFLFYALGALAISLFAVSAVKAATGRYSRYLIGC